jgi:uncharacterized protein YjbJ (UPF0337 family)
MNKDTMEGQYEQLKGKVKEAWGKLTDDDIALMKGKKDQFFGKVQEKYGIAKDEAEKKMKEWEKSCSSSCSSQSDKVA